jgi:hypothetical protein
MDILRSTIDEAVAGTLPLTLCAYASDWPRYEAWCRSERSSPLLNQNRGWAGRVRKHQGPRRGIRRTTVTRVEREAAVIMEVVGRC